MTKPDWWPAWEGQTVVIVASGPSAADVPLSLVKGRARCIAINTSWQLCPWADILYACDVAWWKHAQGCPQFKGLKLSAEARAREFFPDVQLVTLRRPDDRLVLEPLNTLGWGSNGGYHMLNLAAQLRCGKIILVGFDMTLAAGLHWHGPHPQGMNNPRPALMEKWRRAIDNAAEIIAPLGIAVINCSPISALQNYPKMSLEEALAA